MACDKKSYAGVKSARKAMAALSRGRRMRVYRCDDCGLYHLTSTTKPFTKRESNHENYNRNRTDTDGWTD